MIHKFTIFLCLTISATLSALTPSQIYKKCEPSVVKIEGFDKVSGVWSGTGVCILPNVILTNRHITANSFELKVNKNGEDFEVEGFIEYPDHYVDLAVIIIKNSKIAPIEIADTTPEIGLPVYLIGNPYSINYSFSCGTSNGLRKDDGYEFFFNTALSGPGSSGGACLNSEGKLIGIHFGRDSIFSVAVPLKYIKVVVNGVKEVIK